MQDRAPSARGGSSAGNTQGGPSRTPSAKPHAGPDCWLLPRSEDTDSLSACSAGPVGPVGPVGRSCVCRRCPGPLALNLVALFLCLPPPPTPTPTPPGPWVSDDRHRCGGLADAGRRESFTKWLKWLAEQAPSRGPAAPTTGQIRHPGHWVRSLPSRRSNAMNQPSRTAVQRN
jgi:hypothetical protein